MACFAVRSDLTQVRTQKGRHDTRISSHLLSYGFFFLIKWWEAKEWRAFFLSSIAIIITSQYLRSRLSVRGMYNGCSGSPTFAGTIQGGASGSADRVGSKEWLQPFGLCCTGFKKNEVSLTPSSIRLSTQLWRRPGNSVGRYLGGTLGALHMCCPAWGTNHETKRIGDS